MILQHFEIDKINVICIIFIQNIVNQYIWTLCAVTVMLIFCFYSLQDEPDSPAFDSQSSSLIKLNNGTILYLREVNRFLALVCILREDNFDRQGISLILIASIVASILTYRHEINIAHVNKFSIVWKWKQ